MNDRDDNAMRDEPVTVEGYVNKESKKAILFSPAVGDDAWVPKVLLIESAPIVGKPGEIVLPFWKADQLGWAER